MFGGKKPHLLVGCSNGIGRQTTLTYRSSTRFYLDDNRIGTPWKTKLPFPVQCLARIEKREQVTNTLLVEEYSYHHGYYDHAEREFRGFGRSRSDRHRMVHALDTARRVQDIIDEGFHQPVVLTRSWFHTGAPPDDGDLLALFKADYWQHNPTLLSILGAPPRTNRHFRRRSSPAGLTADELREGFRACKSMLLRQEVFALDAPAQGASDAQRIAELDAVFGGAAQLQRAVGSAARAPIAMPCSRSPRAKH